ncbi:hypothetical protein [Caulobacter sp. AP07]|uniref:hypothetical protein n=1 Tax=Caulobacter sp. AP07 TaxID=1144304 RepID=UPI0012FC2FB2|nr:hypothetical protein [Caulobacter sp. AP07]
MIIEIDDDVGIVAAFMKRNFAADQLVSIATELSRLAPLLWAKHGDRKVSGATLGSPLSIRELFL